MISILYVEDDIAQARILELLLRGRGFVLHHASSAAEARYLLERLSIDIALVDGELGDGKCDEKSESGKLVSGDLMGRIPFGRLSGNAAAIPVRLQGAFTVAKPYHVEDLVRAIMRTLGIPHPDGRGADGDAHGNRAA